MKKDNDRGCLIYLTIAIAVVVVYQAVQFFRQPDAIHQILECLGGIGLCIGSIVLLCFCMYIYAQVSNSIERRFVRQSIDYSVQCYAIRMKKVEYGPIPDDLPVESTPAVYYPMSATVTITNYGIWFRERPSSYSEKVTNSETAYFHQHLENSIIPIDNIKLYYVPYSSAGDLGYTIHPAKSAGFTDATPTLQKGHQLKITLIFSSIRRKDNLEETVRLEYPIQLRLTVLNDRGDYDQGTTIELYKAIHKKIASLEKKEENDDDDSWMYRSRPFYW